MMIEWWHWAILGLALLVTDLLLINSFYLLWFGIGALSLSLLVVVLGAVVDMVLWLQVVLWLIFSVLFLMMWLLWMRPWRMRKLVAQAKAELPGQMGVVVRFYGGTGVVRLQKPIGGRDLWDFRSANKHKPGDSVTLLQLPDDGIVKIDDEL